MKYSDFDVVGLSPCERPDARLVRALLRAGHRAIVDAGRDARALDRALHALRDVDAGRLGVRFARGVAVCKDAATTAGFVVVEGGEGVGARIAAAGERPVWVEVTSIEEARAAAAAGAAGLIAKGNESAGRVGTETTFVLVQRLVAALSLPIWARGGIGCHTAAACAVAGAAGVVIDSQLALVRESSLPASLASAIAAMDGSETAVIDDYRVYGRPRSAPLAAALEDPSSLGSRLGIDPASSLVPLGQDAALARSLAERFRSASGVVRAIRDAVADHLRAASVHIPLAPGAGVAATHGTRYPIVQGPMTRVSDTPAFAAAVADGGGLPLLALSLVRGDALDHMLDGTSELLGDRPWGVGILGFAPAELREQQLAAIERVRPPFALIAGGRPSQARPLEDKGIPAYLHVPSPGLLEMFLKEGARRFVFEGRECGGHVGPRSSFVLWESQLDRLLELDDVDSLDILFAGGIHDARSGAMVAAMAAPLVARGARIGVLMGTAYLFTEEAVTSGAIKSAFQDMARSCERTVLVETAPGHATRCADSGFVDAFRRRKAELEAQGMPAKQVWAELETLNLGRLRIASKGLRRDGGALVEVDEGEQRAEGMYMIGDVAGLRGERTTIAELHAEVSEGAMAVIENAAERPSPVEILPSRDDRDDRGAEVAIVGMACVFPGSPDMRTFWSNIVRGVDAVTEVSPARWDPELYYDPEATGAGAGRKTPSKWGGFLPKTVFDPIAFGIPPKSMAAVEPVQLLALDIARRALADAGYAERGFDRSRASVIFGAEAGTDLSGAYGFRAMYPQVCGPLGEALDEALPVLTEDSFPGVLANVIAGRIANRLDLGGVNYTVDAACASSLAALDLAVKELGNRTSDMVLCGGADIHNSINDYLLFSSVHALSPTGRCHTFDANADGITLGEGVACVVLKRLADAERDGDRIYAVVRGIAGSSDGKSLGLTAPRQSGQQKALERAYDRAGISPATVGLVEAHGTGTVVGDRTELKALSEVYGAAGAAPGSCALGSVKSQIGHTKCAAGMAGLIKAALSVWSGVRPPTLHLEQPNPFYDASQSPFQFADTARPWPASRRRAALSALGFGGTNFHAVIEGYGDDAPDVAVDAWPAELCVIRAADLPAARARSAKLADAIDALVARERELNAPLRPALRDVAASMAAGDGPVQLALVCADLPALAAGLRRAAEGADTGGGLFVAAAERDPGKIAVLFPGQGSQRPGMLADLFVAFPSLQRYLGLAEDVAAVMFPPKAFDRETEKAQRAALTDTRMAQPALGMADLAMHELLARFGLKADMFAGHSYGELVALAAAGVLGERELIELSRARAAAILDAAGDDPGTMAAVRAPAERVVELIGELIGEPDGVVIANLNAPKQSVIAGPTAAIDAAVATIEAAGVGVRKLPVACAFHSPVVAGAERALAEHLGATDVGEPTVEVWANASASPYPADADGLRALLASQVARPVRFVEQVRGMYAAGARTFVEVGPGRVLSGLVGKILGDAPHRVVATDRAGEPGLPALLEALAELAVAGAAIEVAALFAGRDIERVDLAKPAPALPKAAWLIDGHRAAPIRGELPKGAYRPFTERIPPAAPPALPAAVYAAPMSAASYAATPPSPNHRAEVAMPPTSPREATVVEFLRTMREMVSAQRDVMLGYLGQAPAAQPHAPLAAPQPVYAQPYAQPGYPQPAAPPPGYPQPVAPQPAAPVPQPMAVAPEGSGSFAVQASEPVAAEPANVADALLAIVSERTGYPAEMLELDLDLEAELSIDSIKRIEILGELRETIGLEAPEGSSDDEVVEELAAKKTLREIIDWLEATRGGAAQPEPAAAATEAVPTPVEDPAEESSIAAPPMGRYVMSASETPAPSINGLTFDGRRFAIVDDGRGVAAALAARLERDGATVEIVPQGKAHEHRVDGLVHLGCLADGAGHDEVKRLFALARGALMEGATWMVAASPLGGRFGRVGSEGDERPLGGVAGLVKTLAREWPDARIRAVDLDPGEDAAALAEHLRVEMLAVDDAIEVGYADGVRYALTAEEVPLPETDGRSLPLDGDSVVLLTGGARGITARMAIAIASRYGAQLELVGRSPLPEGEEDAEIAAATDDRALRALLVARKVGGPKDVERELRRLRSAREIRATLAAIAEAGGKVRYHAVDVRDDAAFRALVASIYADRGRLDGVIHGAGVLEDKLARDKTEDSFARVFDTKVTGALAIAETVREDAKFVAFFTSVSGVFGNRGQVDYAAANDALDKLARWLDRRIQGRAFAVAWGPWSGTGMVSAELERQYNKRGIGLIDPQSGVDLLLAEIERGHGQDPNVVVMCADPETMAGGALPPTERRPRAATEG